MTPAELLERLCEIYGVDNLNQLAPKLGYEPRLLYRWRDAPDGPGFKHTLELLRLAKLLNEDAPVTSEAPPLDDPAVLLQQLEDVVARVLPRLRTHLLSRPEDAQGGEKR